jgi:L-fucose mutarotase
MASLERAAFYERARAAFAVVATSENRPYGCFLLVKGVTYSPARSRSSRHSKATNGL